MTAVEFELETIRTSLAFLVSAARKNAQKESEPLPEFITLEQAARLKGGASLNTYKTRYYLQPCGGAQSVRVGGRKCWKRADVLEWLSVDDTALDSYLRRFGVEVKKY